MLVWAVATRENVKHVKMIIIFFIVSANGLKDTKTQNKVANCDTDLR